MELSRVWYFKTQGNILGPVFSDFYAQFSSMCSGDPFAMARRGDWSYWLPATTALATAESQDLSFLLSHEKRRSPRTRISGAVILTVEGKICRGQLCDISTTGLAIEVEEQLVRDLDLGTISLCLPSRHFSSPPGVRARLIRVAGRNHGKVRLGLEFVRLPLELRQQIMDLEPDHPEAMAIAC